MRHHFALVDAIPGKEDQVFQALAKFPEVVGKRLLAEKVANADIIVMIAAPDGDGAQKIISGKLRGISGVMSIRTVMPEHTIAPKVGKLVMEMEKEARAPR